MPPPVSPEIRAEALRLAPEIGVTAAAQQVGVAPSTVSRWMVSAGIATDPSDRTRAATKAASLAWEVRRADMAIKLGAVAEKALGVVDVALDKGETRKANDTSAALARLIDKAQLLSGGATSRSEHRSELDAELERLAERVDA